MTLSKNCGNAPGNPSVEASSLELDRRRPLLVEVSAGELLDKITILEIKKERIKDTAKLANIDKELAALERVCKEQILPSAQLNQLIADLKAVNEALWQIEDEIRDCERAKNFCDGFINLARMVYHRNDVRAALKRRVNDLLGSDLVEEKSYKPYDDAVPPN
jgi:Family of unknown function (DUF6165)